MGTGKNPPSKSPPLILQHEQLSVIYGSGPFYGPLRDHYKLLVDSCELTAHSAAGHTAPAASLPLFMEELCRDLGDDGQFITAIWRVITVIVAQ